MLKKTLFTAVLLVLSSASLSFALTSATLPSSGESFKYNLSSNVLCLYATDNTHVSYAMACKHKAGTRAFVVSNATSKVYYKENTSTDTQSGYVGIEITGGKPLQDVQGISPGAQDSDFTSFDPL